MLRKSTLLAVLVAMGVTASASAQSLRIGLAEDPDVLDPTNARTFVGRLVFAALCDKLFDVDKDLNIVPQLATGYEWSNDNKKLTIKLRQGVKFHDGEPFNAAAAKYSLDRYRLLPSSFRRTELTFVDNVQIVDDFTINLNLRAPFSPLLAQLSDRSGMMLSPKAVEALGANFGTKPVCAGPFKFVERVAQDRIVVERFADYWDKGQIHFDRITYLPIPDSTIRLANLQSGRLDFVERVAATDLDAVRKDNRLKLSTVVEIGYQGITINVNNGERAKNPLGQDRRVRQALELALDREVMIQVVYNGEYTPGNQWVPPNNFYYNSTLPVPKRDLARAKALLAETGHQLPIVVNLMVPNNPDLLQIGQVIQAMTREAGFDVRLLATEFASALQASMKGEYEAFLLAWSGRADPDGNLQQFVTCPSPTNDSRYCNPEVDRLVSLGRTVSAPEERKKVYAQVSAITLKDLPIVYLYHRKWFWAYTSKLSGLKEYPDGMVRLQGLRFN